MPDASLSVASAEAPKKWEDLLDPKWKDAINVKVSNSGLQHGVWFMLKPIRIAMIVATTAMIRVLTRTLRSSSKIAT